MSNSGRSIADMMMMMLRFKESVDKSAKTRRHWIPELPCFGCVLISEDVPKDIHDNDVEDWGNNKHLRNSIKLFKCLRVISG